MKDIIVVDASIAVKWVLEEEDSKIAFALLDDCADNEVTMIAPALLFYETTNTLHRRVQSGKLPLEDARKGLEEIVLSVLTFDFSTSSLFSMRTIKFARQFGLPAAYDACYLALAEREECELWTADTRLWNAVKGKLDWVHNISEYQPS